MGNIENKFKNKTVETGEVTEDLAKKAVEASAKKEEMEVLSAEARAEALKTINADPELKNRYNAWAGKRDKGGMLWTEKMIQKIAKGEKMEGAFEEQRTSAFM